MVVHGKMDLGRNQGLIFPHSVWEVILEKVENSEDILSVLTAFPQLKNLADGKQFSWLISDLMPLIFPKFLNVNDIKSCRLASKRWNNSVGACLESHSDRLPYKSPTQVAGIPETHFNYTRLPSIKTNFRRFSLTQYDEIRSPVIRRRNPFPGRSVEVTVKGDRDEYHDRWFDYLENSPRSPHKLHVDLREAVQEMKLFGHHIWHITFQFPFIGLLHGEVLISNVLQPLFHCLSYLPNLKSLKLSRLGIQPRDMSPETCKNVMEFIARATFPFQLETLDLCLDFLYQSHEESYSNNINRNFMTALVNHDQVKKLVTLSAWWKPEYGIMFPNLSELSIRVSDKITLQNMLHDLQSSPVRKLELEILTCDLFVSDILDILESYHVESLELTGEIQEKPDNLSGSDSVKLSAIRHMRKSMTPFFSGRFFRRGRRYRKSVLSIRCLALSVSPQLDFKFLQSLPSLQYLTLEIDNVEWDKYREDYIWQDTDSNNNNSFRTCLRNLYYKGEDEPKKLEFIWNELPNLEMLTVHIEKHQNQYIRECQKSVFHIRRTLPVAPHR